MLVPLLLCIATSGEIAIASLDEPANLEGAWKLTLGDDPSYASPGFDDSAWQTVKVPGGIGAQGYRDHVGHFWYRVRLKLPRGTADKQLSIQLGMIDSAYEVFLDGVKAGGKGRVDEPVIGAHDARGLYAIRAEALDDGELVVAVRGVRTAQRASSNPNWGGIWRGPQALGDTQRLAREALAYDRDGIIASAAIVIIGLYHLLLYRRRRNETSYLWFGLFCIAIAGNMRMETEATHIFGTIIRAKLVFFFLLLASVFFVQFLWPFLGVRLRWWWRAHQGVVLAYWAIMLAWPTTWFLDITMPWLELFIVLPLMLGTTSLIVRKAWAGDREARTLFLGTLALVGALGVNVLLDRAVVELPLMLSYAMILFVLSMAVSLSNRFARVFHELDKKNAALLRMDALADEVRVLNAQLGARVKDRSEELTRSLDALVESGAIGGLAHGTKLDGRWQVDRLLGTGGMGSVYAGMDLVTSTPVAIKIARAKTKTEIESLRRFLREARAVVSVVHPAVVRMLHVDVSNEGVFYQVQELVDGETLDSHLRLRAIEAPIVARVGAVLASALAAAHARGVIHRDVKPSNIILTNSEPGVKLLDFGVAKLVSSSTSSGDSSDGGSSSDHTGTGRHVGTPAYMAPEQRLASDAAISDRVDVYALGLVLKRALAGPVPQSALPIAAGSDAFASLLSKCIDDDATARPSAETLARSLTEIADALGAPQTLVWGAGETTGGELTRLMKELARST